jgi:DNA-binding IclR family transcriptional regulator
MGIAYIAHCSAQERGIVLQLLSTAQPFEAAAIKARLYEARINGFAIRHSVRGRDSATLAVPVLRNGYAVAALGMTTFGRAMTRVTVEHFAPVLKQTATQISEAYATSSEEGKGTS